MSRRVKAGRVACGWKWHRQPDGRLVADAVNWTEDTAELPKAQPIRSARGVAASTPDGQGSLL